MADNKMNQGQNQEKGKGAAAGANPAQQGGATGQPEQSTGGKAGHMGGVGNESYGQQRPEEARGDQGGKQSGSRSGSEQGGQKGGQNFRSDKER